MQLGRKFSIVPDRAIGHRYPAQNMPAAGVMQAKRDKRDPGYKVQTAACLWHLGWRPATEWRGQIGNLLVPLALP